MAKRYGGPSRDEYDAMHARSSAIAAGKPSADRARGPGPTGHGVYKRAFAPGPIPDITKDPAKPRKLSVGRSLAGGGR